MMCVMIFFSYVYVVFLCGSNSSCVQNLELTTLPFLRTYDVGTFIKTKYIIVVVFILDTIIIDNQIEDSDGRC